MTLFTVYATRAKYAPKQATFTRGNQIMGSIWAKSKLHALRKAVHLWPTVYLEGGKFLFVQQNIFPK